VDSDDEDVTALLEALRKGLDGIRSREDTPAKFKAASQFAEGLREFADEVAALRRDVVIAIRENEKLKLRPLAGRVGISTTRLHQLIKAGEKDQKGDLPDGAHEHHG
jgi:hypothetical protein